MGILNCILCFLTSSNPGCGNLSGVDQVIKAMFKAEANENNVNKSSGWTPVLFAAKQGIAAAVEALLKAGTDVNAAVKDGESILDLIIALQLSDDVSNAVITTLIAGCVRGGFLSVIEALCKAGADMNQPM
jgi:ankyrin repeat protein